MTGGAAAAPPGRGAAFSWCLFDFANSGYPTVVATFVFSAYVTKAVAATPEAGTAAWGYAMGASGLLIALLAPIFGAVADHSGRRKPWLGLFSLLCVASTALMWTIRPDPAFLLAALVLAALSNAAFEIGGVFYNAMLPDVTTPERMGRLSGWAWGLGYAGGLACLVIALLALVQADPPPFGLDKAAAEPVRATLVLVALWFVVFGWPLFAFVPERPTGRVLALGAAARGAIDSLKGLPALFRGDPRLGWFLLARMLYTEGLNTLFAFGGIYAAGTFDMGFDQIIVFGIGLNITAGLGAFAFGWIDDWLGSPRTIVVGLIGLIGFCVAVLLVEDTAWFVGLALTMGIFFGPVQAASRTHIARVAPPDRRGELFGLFALTGKISAFAGPLAVGLATDLSGSQRLGMATVVVFLVAGLGLLVKTRAPRG
ncbi:major facilitator transporter [Rhodospirillum rubrum F11]|uniref:Major facilitator superfamily MFS_1 n=2 Tax=Rhodospirillum rubrum TaxID=1085 RepID=Q2RN40_RHORT|nr:MFS transporter [Rhodospirillum rubrum]ABC24455.1 Major facilitator superfamily MFS_1 [Rhodospirillum rubrum ATCC 11170]AEO50206.1 major facilitator transporter [Rhodospirillum rubrum F11]MBK5956181.1 MFS transporter [Rhodospirillum rubrum]QXG80374.1 MFS transporter [Rhodospirillum rubrum]HCF17845.1 MFS transporter [Rhodospirillum rubrum]